MSKAKMQAARELIQAKEYDQARAILKTVDHPTARAWEEKLNQIAPAKTAKQKLSRGKKIRIALLGVGMLIIAIYIVSYNIEQQNIARRIQAINDEAQSEAYQRHLENCIIKYNTNPRAFDRCMEDAPER